MADKSVEFIVTLAESPAAFKIGKSGKGRIVLSFDEAQLPQALQLLAWLDRALKVRFELAQEEVRYGNQDGAAVSR